MCGRFTQDIDDEDLVEIYDLNPDTPRPETCSRWNGAPTQSFAVCRTTPSGERALAVHRWGLIPAWARDPKVGTRLINARAESVDSKPSFRSPFRHRRCLIPANGWFEWQMTPLGKRPWWIAREGGPLSFAGLWDIWDRGNGPLYSFTILTCPASESVRAIHARQPSIIPSECHSEWLDPGASSRRLLELARTAHCGPFALRRVSADVNSPRNDYPDLLRPL